MSVITLPAAFQPTTCQLSLRTNQRVTASPFGGSEQAIDLLNDRWVMTCELPPRLMRDGGWLEAFIGQMRGQTNTTRVHHFARPYPLGTVRGTLTLSAAANQGARSLSVTGCVPSTGTLLAGDMLEVGGLLVMVGADCQALGANLLSYSSQFDNALWTKHTFIKPFGSGSVVDATTAPDGTTTADLITETATLGTHYVYRLVTVVPGQPYTFSQYYKPNGRRYLRVSFVSGASVHGCYCDVDLQTTTIVNQGSLGGGSFISATITAPDTYGFVRVSVSGATLAASSFVVSTLRDAATNVSTEAAQNYTGDGLAGVYFWGAQFEPGAVASDYKATTATPVGAVITVPITNALRVAQSSGAAVTWSKPSVSVRLLDTSGVGYAPAIANGASFDFGEAI